MTRDDIIYMAAKLMPDMMPSTPEELAKFAALIVAAERKECAKACEEVGAWTEGEYSNGCKDCATAIRARGQ
jgi:hypothetical protein